MMKEEPHFGPLLSGKGITFRLWAPAARTVELVSEKILDMQKEHDWFSAYQSSARAGALYQFRIDGELIIPDPASRFQPHDIHGPSEVVDHVYEWENPDWKGRPWHEAIFLELHVGTFTPEGTFLAAIEKLDHVADAGITAIELMPLADFQGRWNWGYDGVLPFAPDSSYGRPDDLRALIDAAHDRGLMVFLDVVYNHLGPGGDFMNRIAPQFFAQSHTPWGQAINYENPEVRRFAVENAVYWLEDFRFDGLRLDAVHAITEPGRTLLLREISTAAAGLAAETGRYVHLLLENDANQAGLLDPSADAPGKQYRAQWNDDYHHAFHVLLTGEDQGYYRDYREASHHLARTLAEGFSYQGASSPYRKGEPRGEKTTSLPAIAFVNFLQNHDQIGNRRHSERLTTLARSDALEAALTITFLAPAPPLMFMGDEWGAREPFPFFCDFEGDLAEAVRAGRRKDLAQACGAEDVEPRDPFAEQTMRLAKLDWSKVGEPVHRGRLDLVRRLLAARRCHVTPRLPRLKHGHGEAQIDNNVLTARWWFASGETMSIVANLSDRTQPRPSAAQGGEPIWGDALGGDLGPWTVHASIVAA